MDATVIIVSYNTRALTLSCLASVFQETAKISFDVVVVDNDSHDGSPKAITEAFPQVQVLALEENIGFAAANNLAARESSRRYIVLLNPDTVVLDRAIERLVQFADSLDADGIVGGRTLYPDGTLNPTSCWGSPTLWSLACRSLGLSTLFRGTSIFDPESLGRWQRDTEQVVDIVSGCFLLIPRRLWDRLGGFAEEYFMYGEDTDLNIRARKLGHLSRLTPSATIIHLGGASEPLREDKLVRLLTAERKLLRHHWRRSLRLVALPLHSFGVWLRSLPARTTAFAASRRRLSNADSWRRAWTRRSEWR